MRFFVVAIGLMFLPGCDSQPAPQPTGWRTQLSAEQKVVQSELIKSLLQSTNPDELVGRSSSHFTELLLLADGVRIEQERVRYIFSEIPPNQEGPGTMMIEVSKHTGCIMDVSIIYPEW